ncbi:unnamed protein product [Clonostachys solani]|uniref:Uncharacterized protein n=1 Tax=Clonostachys solani TaxID=160281 RepID=A0A9P0ET94_9HYPO|nr:unnamed protein product [Clonostachys solani]
MGEMALAAGRWTGKEADLAGSERFQKFEAQKFEMSPGESSPPDAGQESRIFVAVPRHWGNRDYKPQQGAKKDGDMMQRWLEEAATDPPFNTIAMVAVAQIETPLVPNEATSKQKC